MGSRRLGCTAGAVKPRSPGQSEAPPWVTNVFEMSPERAAQTIAVDNVAPFQGLVYYMHPPPRAALRFALGWAVRHPPYGGGRRL